MSAAERFAWKEGDIEITKVVDDEVTTAPENESDKPND